MSEWASEWVIEAGVGIGRVAGGVNATMTMLVLVSV